MNTITHNARLLVSLVCIAFYSSAFSYGNEFTCPYGTEAACLDYGDKVCSSSAKCVRNDAICFDSYTCNYEGFICKSEYTDLSDEYESLHNEYEQTVNDYNELLRQYKSAMSEYEDFRTCVSYASSLDEAQACH